MTEAAGEGIDTVRSSVNFALGANIESLIGTGMDQILTGNELDNGITGTAGNDVLDGGAGNDSLAAGAGNDTLTGGAHPPAGCAVYSASSTGCFQPAWPRQAQ